VTYSVAKIPLRRVFISYF